MVLQGLRYCNRSESLFKNHGGVQPLNIKNIFIKEFHKGVTRANMGALTGFLETQQMALSNAGGHKLVHMFRMSFVVNYDSSLYNNNGKKKDNKWWRLVLYVARGS